MWSSLIIVAAIAVATMSATPVAAQATQSAVANQASAQAAQGKGGTLAVHPDMSAREFFDFKEYIRGIQRSAEQYDQLKKYGCTVTQQFAPKIVEEAIAGGYMCSKKFFEKIGSKNTAGTMYDITYLGADGATVVKTIKGTKVGQNYIQISTFSLSANSDGKPQTVTYNYHANGGQYMAQMLSSLPGTILGGMVPQLAASMLNDCDEQCRTGIVNIVSSSSDSNSAAQAVAQLQQTNVGASVPAGCGTGGNTPCSTTPRH